MIGDKKRARGGGRGGGSRSSSGSSSVSSAIGMFPFFANMYSSATKAEQILSRYRPIAPKPPATPSKADADSSSPAAASTNPQQSSSSVSVGSRKGSRKRPPAQPDSARSYKRAAPNNRKPQQPQQPQQQDCSGFITRISGPQAQLPQQQQLVPVIVPAVVVAAAGVNEMGSLSSTITTSVSSDLAPLQEPSSPWKGLRSQNPHPAHQVHPHLLRSTSSPRESRSARSASSNFRSELIRANVQIPPPPPPPPLLPPIISNRILEPHQQQQQQQQWHQLAEEFDDDDRPKLVTLSLLPDTPAQLSESCATSNSTSRAGNLLRDDKQLELSLCSAPPRYTMIPPRYTTAEVPPAAHFTASVIDPGYLERAYGVSSDPVVLTGGGADGITGVTLWSNLSYNKVMSERLSGKRAAGPYIDPLGLPTQLGCFRFRTRQGAPECSAVLWGFLKKFMLLEDNGSQQQQQIDTNIDQPHQLQQQRPQQIDQQQQGLAIPQPVRATSAVLLEIVSEMNCYSGGLPTGSSLESIQAQLELSGSPALVTDRSNRVRWVSSGYNQLVASVSPRVDHERGINLNQNHQQSLCRSEEESCSSCVGAHDHHHYHHPLLRGGSKVIFQWERSPYSALSLVGLVRVDWIDSGKRCCLTGVPCEMRRLDDPQLGSLFIWKLNLNVDNVRRSS